MKLKTRILTSFLIVMMLPIILMVLLVGCIGKSQLVAIEKSYGITESSVETASNSIHLLSRLTEDSYNKLQSMVTKEQAQMDDVTYLASFNKELQEMRSYLVVMKNGKVIYLGADETDDKADALTKELPKYNEEDMSADSGVYIGGDQQVLVREVDFTYTDGEDGSAYIITNVESVIPEVRRFVIWMLICIVLILIFTAAVLTVWIYRGILSPVNKLRDATRKIAQGNLDFELQTEGENDVMGALICDIEEMRKHLKEQAEENIKAEQQSKELISNISHDLKTPVTTIKGYAEGILDGVAGTPEKQQKYVRTIYNKAVEMDKLINELTLYSKIDTNRIPYNFNTVPVNGYFNDCAEELELELEGKNIEFAYFNYVEDGVKIIADAEQIARVVHNIVNNSVKYMDKSRGKINLRVKDVGDFVQVEIEDNGKGIDPKSLPYIFDRFYRTDASRNSAMGGSGIGLSIVKKIVEDHGGKIWATSRENTGTTMYFVLRKYQEVPVNG